MAQGRSCCLIRLVVWVVRAVWGRYSSYSSHALNYLTFFNFVKYFLYFLFDFIAGMVENRIMVLQPTNTLISPLVKHFHARPVFGFWAFCYWRLIMDTRAFDAKIKRLGFVQLTNPKTGVPKYRCSSGHVIQCFCNGDNLDCPVCKGRCATIAENLNKLN